MASASLIFSVELLPKLLLQLFFSSLLFEYSTQSRASCATGTAVTPKSFLLVLPRGWHHTHAADWVLLTDSIWFAPGTVQWVPFCPGCSGSVPRKSPTGNAQLLQWGAGLCRHSTLREEPQLWCLGELAPLGKMVGLELLHWTWREKFASISLTGKGKKKISVPEKRMELSRKCVCSIRWCLAAFNFFFFISNGLSMTYFKE